MCLEGPTQCSLETHCDILKCSQTGANDHQCRGAEGTLAAESHMVLIRGAAA